MVSANPCLSDEEVDLYYSPEVLEDKPKGWLKQFFSLQFLLFSKDYDSEKIDVLSLWHNFSRSYRNEEVKEQDRKTGSVPLSALGQELASRHVSKDDYQPCIDALLSILYLSQNLPYPSWMQDSKEIRIEEDPKTGKPTAVAPVPPNAVVLTPECCIALSGESGSVSIEEKEAPPQN